MNINVLHIRDSGAMLGAENVILELSRELQSLGITPTIGVFSHNDGKSTELARQATELNIKTIDIPCNKKVDLNTIRFLKDYIQNNNIHLVHTHGYIEDFYAWLAKSTPLIATNHLWKRTTTALKVYAYIDGKVLNKFDKIVAVSAPIQEDIIKAGINPEKTAVIPNGINIEKFISQRELDKALKLKDELGIPREHIIIGMISSLTKEKGHAAALACLSETLKTHPNTHVLIVGDGPELENLHQLTITYGIEKNITFTGNRSDIPALLTVIDIFLLYSTIEGLPMALLEAMACGKAVIATNVGDVGRAIIENETGILLQDQKKTHLSQALNTLLKDESKRSDFGQAAQKKIINEFSSDVMAQHYAQLYHEMLS